MARHLRGAAGIAMLAIALALPAIGETPAKADLRLPRAATPEAARFSSEGLEAPGPRHPRTSGGRLRRDAGHRA
jgi:hypothetical protein